MSCTNALAGDEAIKLTSRRGTVGLDGGDMGEAWASPKELLQVIELIGKPFGEHEYRAVRLVLRKTT